jgi:type IV pilus assembly protein PilF
MASDAASRLSGLLAGLSLLLLGGCATEGGGALAPDGSAGTSQYGAASYGTVDRPAPTVNGGAATTLSQAGTGAGDNSPRTDLMTASDESETAKRSRIRLELAGAYFAQGQTGTALDEVKRALAANPSSVPAYNLRGLIYASLGENALADDSFRRALALQPSDVDVLHNHAWYLCTLKRYPEARLQFNAAIAQPQNRDRAKTLFALGVCESAAGELDAAEKALLGSFEIDAGNPATSAKLSEVLMRKGDLERARFYVQRVNNMPQFANADTLWLAARIEHRRGNASAVDELGAQLRARFPGTRQTSAFEHGQFNE